MGNMGFRRGQGPGEQSSKYLCKLAEPRGGEWLTIPLDVVMLGEMFAWSG